MGQIKSNTISAGSAISELVGVDTSNAQNQQVEFFFLYNRDCWNGSWPSGLQSNAAGYQ